MTSKKTDSDIISPTASTPNPSDPAPQNDLRLEHLALGQELLKRDERNDFWKQIGKVGAYLSKRARRGIMRFWD